VSALVSLGGRRAKAQDQSHAGQAELPSPVTPDGKHVFGLLFSSVCHDKDTDQPVE
jgi:hypothetical protein